MILQSKNDISISQVLTHIFGFKEALYLKVLDLASDASKTDSFKCVYKDVAETYGLTRHTQANCLKSLEKASIVSSWAGEIPKEGRNFKLDKDSIADLNLIILSVTCKDIKRFQFKTKKFVGANVDLEKIKEIVSKF